ncbi:hypothetical protein [Pseudophaeobacter sp.]|uniref:hypothetical protein n=1 Tax=Pseudophaeobacter sp. TaxID=1971739 RepID=UPI0026326115|nr:hypothetical protein [Pseudophaeobacter sp.]
MATIIDENLFLELSEVKVASQDLTLAVDQHNFLPEDFPNAQFLLLSKSLCGLNDGSLEGARLPLEHAAVRLSEIRRRFFLHSTGAVQEDEAEFYIPSLERGDALDLRFSSLLSAISTALDAYREQARNEYQSLNTQENIEILPWFHETRCRHTKCSQWDTKD